MHCALKAGSNTNCDSQYGGGEWGTHEFGLKPQNLHIFMNGFSEYVAMPHPFKGFVLFLLFPLVNRLYTVSAGMKIFLGSIHELLWSVIAVGLCEEKIAKWQLGSCEKYSGSSRKHYPIFLGVARQRQRLCKRLG